MEKNSSFENITTLSKTNFAGAFYFFAFVFLVVFALNSLSNILTPIAIAILIWFLINAFANQIKRLPFLNEKIVSPVDISFINIKKPDGFDSVGLFNSFVFLVGLFLET